MARYKFTIARTAIVEEYYEIEADSEQEALDVAYDGGYPDPIRTEFIDWRDDEWTVVEREETCKLYNMVKEYDPARV